MKSGWQCWAGLDLLKDIRFVHQQRGIPSILASGMQCSKNISTWPSLNWYQTQQEKPDPNPNIGNHTYVFFNKQIRRQQFMDVIQPNALVLQNLISLPSTRSKVHVLSIWVVQRMALQLLITVELESLKTSQENRNASGESMMLIPSLKLTKEWNIHHFDGIYQDKWKFSWAMLVSGRVSHVDSVHACNRKSQISESSKFCW